MGQNSIGGSEPKNEHEMKNSKAIPRPHQGEKKNSISESKSGKKKYREATN